MRRALLAIAMLASLVLTGTASAEQMRASRSQVNSAPRKGPVAKLVELERRKNEWLRQQLGR